VGSCSFARTAVSVIPLGALFEVGGEVRALVVLIKDGSAN